MLWKEIHIEGQSGRSWIAMIAGGLLALLTIGSGLLVLGQYLWNQMLGGGMDFRSLPEDMNIWFRIAGSGVASLMLLMVGVRASTSITTELERDTFDALVAKPLSAQTILPSKLVGSLISLRMGWIWFGCMLAIGIFTGGVHLLAVPIVITAWFIYAAFVQHGRAVVLDGVHLVDAVHGLHGADDTVPRRRPLAGHGHVLLLGVRADAARSSRRLSRILGQVPGRFDAADRDRFLPVSYSWQDLQRNFNHREFRTGEIMVFSLIGLFLWAMACPVLSSTACCCAAKGFLQEIMHGVRNGVCRK